MNICKDRAFEVLTRLSVPRIAGTPGELAAAELLKAECDKIGVPAVIEAFEIDMPEVFEAKLTVTKPEVCEINCIGIGRSGNTPDEGICGPLLYVEDGMEANLLDAEGKILLLSGMAKPEVLERMRKSGALGYIACHGSLYDPEEMIPEIRTRNERRKPGEEDINFPGVVIHITDASKLLRMGVEEICIVEKQDGNKKGTSHNVVATIEGTEKPDEIIAFSAHYDSVIYGTGAWDNGTGSITIMEIMHHFAKNPPKRTVKFVWCGSEEIGICGAKAYCKDHKDELDKHRFNINVDMTGVLLGYEKAVCTCDERIAKHIDFMGCVEGFPIVTELDTYPSDSTAFAEAGVPAMTFARLNPRGGAEIHSRRDMMEVLDPTAFIKTVEFMVKFSEQVVNAKVFPVPRELPKEINEKLEKFRKMEGMKKEEEKKEDKKEEKPAETKAETK